MLLTGKSVLIVEDESLVSMLLEDMVGDIGCETCLRASSVPEALQIIDTMKFDVAIVDMNLAGTSGDPVAEALLLKGVPFIISTGYDPEAIAGKWAHVPFVQKPFKEAELEAALQSALGDSTRRDNVEPVI